MLSLFIFTLWKPPLLFPLSLFPPTPTFWPGNPLHYGIEPSQHQLPLLTLMSEKTILCYICILSLVVYSPWELWGYWWFRLFFLLWGCKPFSSLGPFSSSAIGDPVLSPLVGCEHPPLYFSGTGKASQETDISGSCQLALVGICLHLVTVYGLDPQVGQSLNELSLSLCSALCLCISSHGLFWSPF